MLDIVSKTRIAMALVLVGALCRSQTAQQSRRCLPDNDLYPCRCNPLGFFSLVCDNVTATEQLESTLEKASENNIVEVSVRYSDMDYLPLQRINFLGFVYLNLRSVTLTRFCEDVLYGRIRLEQLHLEDVRTRTPLPWNMLTSLMDMKRFLVSNMKLETVDDVLLHMSSSLQSFSMVSTGTRSLPRRAFANFPDLVYVCINETDITALARSMFPVPAKIRYLYVENSRIETLPGNMFTDMPDLERVGLNGNLMREIQQTTFSPVWHQLSALLLEGNPIKCHCDMVWIAERKSPPILTGSCQSPKTKYGTKIKFLNKTDFLC